MDLEDVKKRLEAIENKLKSRQEYFIRLGLFDSGNGDREFRINSFEFILFVFAAFVMGVIVG